MTTSSTLINTGSSANRLLPLAYQVLLWLGYTLFWHTIFSPSFFSLGGFVTSLLYTLAHALASYVNILWLIPRLWRRSKVVYFIALVLIMILGSGILAGMLYVWLQSASPASVDVFFGDTTYLVASTLGSTFSGVTLSMGIFLLLQRRKLEQRQEQLEKEKMKAELQFLRQQIDPHFLFNVLNNIYFLIKKDPDAAAEALAGFSELLRYQIYQTQTDTIPLADEFEYLRKYANLASLRLPQDADINVRLPPPEKGLRIPPLLLLPLVENAFKHVDKDAAHIRVIASLNDQHLQFEVSNSCGVKTQSSVGDPKPAGGVGLDNLNKRLKLLYPQEHEIKVNDTAGHYSVSLKIALA